MAEAVLPGSIKALGAELVGEDYIFFGSANVSKAIEKIKAAKPDVVLSSVVGDTNKAFYQALTDAGLPAEKLPVVSVSIGEEEAAHLNKIGVEKLKIRSVLTCESKRGCCSKCTMSSSLSWIGETSSRPPGSSRTRWSTPSTFPCHS